MKVPFIELKTEHHLLREDLRRVWEEALDNAAFIGGAAVEDFERAFAEFCEVRHAIGVGNGTDALVLALKALEIGEGAEVILPANSFVATAEAIVHCGATPVFVDIDTRTYNIDVQQIEDRITQRTKAIIPVHLYGQPADMRPILDIAGKYELRVIEDAAQAHGARYHGSRAGSMGDAACFSFYPAKNLGACGDGGAVVTNDGRVANAIRQLRDHGGLRKYEHHVVGHNSRLDSVQAAVLQVKLKHLDERNEARRWRAHVYDRMLSRIPSVATPLVRDGVQSVYHLYVIRIEKGDRNTLQAYLRDCGVQTGIHYPAPIHRTPAFARFESRACPVAERYAARIISLPMYPEIEERQIGYIADMLDVYMTSMFEGEKSSAQPVDVDAQIRGRQI